MLKKTITFEDYNGEERTEDFFFNLSKAELMEMEMSTAGGFENMIKKIIAEKDAPKIMEIFKEIILKSYGEKSADGKRFLKSPEAAIAFTQTEAYSELFMELLSDSEAAAAFINGIVPKGVAEEAAKQQAPAVIK